jgi:4-hydroxy-tetrahydrodipicolinate reductase
LSTEAFAAGVSEGRIGHRGLEESCALVASGLGFHPDEVRALIEPVVSDTVHPRPGIPGGQVAGVRQSARAFVGTREVVRLDLEMSVGAPSPHDRILIAGDPPIDMTIAGGIQGDRGTIGTVLSAIPLVAQASPGLLDIRGLGLGL